MSNQNRGIAYMIFASFMFAWMGIFAKELSFYMSSVEVVFFRNVFGVVIMTLAILKSPLKQVGGKPLLLIFRGVIGFLALLMFFYNIATIPLAEAMTFSKTSPIFTAIFAYFFMKESLSFKSWIGIFIGFIGIVFITKFTGEGLDKADYLGILSGVGAALAYTSIRELKNYYDTRVIVLSFMLTGTIFPVIFMIIAEFGTVKFLDFAIAKFTMPTGIAWVYIVLLGLVSTLAQVYMTKAYSSTKAGIIGAVGYLNIVFAVILSVILLGDMFPNNLTIFGIILIVISGLLVSKEKVKYRLI